MSNFQSIPTDCPQRERRGWLGDAQLSAETVLYNFDAGAAYTNFIRNIGDAQDPKTGAVPDCVPWYGHGHLPADPAWGTAYTLITAWVHEYYDDMRVIADNYDGIRAHLEEVRATAARDKWDGLLAFSLYGDWCPPSGCRGSGTQTNSMMVSSYYYIYDRSGSGFGTGDPDNNMTRLCECRDGFSGNGTVCVEDTEIKTSADAETSWLDSDRNVAIVGVAGALLLITAALVVVLRRVDHRAEKYHPSGFKNLIDFAHGRLHRISLDREGYDNVSLGSRGQSPLHYYPQTQAREGQFMFDYDYRNDGHVRPRHERERSVYL